MNVKIVERVNLWSIFNICLIYNKLVLSGWGLNRSSIVIFFTFQNQITLHVPQIYRLMCIIFMYARIAKFMGPKWGPPGSCRPQMGPMFVLWTLLSEWAYFNHDRTIMPSWHGNAFRIIGLLLWDPPVCGRFASQRASNAALWYIH